MEGVPVAIDFRPPLVNRAVVVGGGLLGNGRSRGCSPTAASTVTLATRARRGRARRSARPAATRATCPRSTSPASTATTLAEAPFDEADLVVVALPSRAFRTVVDGAAGHARRCSA